MHEKDYIFRPSNPDRGYYLPHYQGSDRPSAMRHPAWDTLPDHLPDLATIKPLGKRAASDPEFIPLVQAYNEAPGHLPDTPNRMLLTSLPDVNEDNEYVELASMLDHDDDSNGIIYLTSEKFVSVVGLEDFVNGRETTKNGRSSKEVINQYAKKSYDAMPPVQHVNAYYEEQSGNTYFALRGDGAHRLAGAVRRGDQYVPATSVVFIRLEGNVISEQLERLMTQEQEVRQRSFGERILKFLKVRKN